MKTELRNINAACSEALGIPVCRCDHSQTPSPRYSSETGFCLTCGNAGQRDYTTSAEASALLRSRMRELGFLYAIRDIGPVFVAAFWRPVDAFRLLLRTLLDKGGHKP